MELTLDHPFIIEWPDLSRSKRPPREQLRPPSERAKVVDAFLHSPYAPGQDTASPRVVRLLSAWGD
jgi:hypothetical protein